MEEGENHTGKGRILYQRGGIEVRSQPKICCRMVGCKGLDGYTTLEKVRTGVATGGRRKLIG